VATPRKIEAQEQEIVCRWLDAHRLVYFSVPNGAQLGGNRFAQIAKLKKTGLKVGVPDLIIVTPVESEFVGVALEMKRDSKSQPSDEQDEWLLCLAKCGWCSIVGHGADDAIEKIRKVYRI
jgi:hypothetical protein